MYGHSISRHFARIAAIAVGSFFLLLALSPQAHQALATITSMGVQ